MVLNNCEREIIYSYRESNFTQILLDPNLPVVKVFPRDRVLAHERSTTGWCDYRNTGSPPVSRSNNSLRAKRAIAHLPKRKSRATDRIRKLSLPSFWSQYNTRKDALSPNFLSPNFPLDFLAGALCGLHANTWANHLLSLAFVQNAAGAATRSIVVTLGWRVLGATKLGDFGGHDFTDYFTDVSTQKVPKDLAGFRPRNLS